MALSRQCARIQAPARSHERDDAASRERSPERLGGCRAAAIEDAGRISAEAHPRADGSVDPAVPAIDRYAAISQSSSATSERCPATTTRIRRAREAAARITGPGASGRAELVDRAASVRVGSRVSPAARGTGHVAATAQESERQDATDGCTDHGGALVRARMSLRAA